jgi:hypothetical protein
MLELFRGQVMGMLRDGPWGALFLASNGGMGTGQPVRETFHGGAGVTGMSRDGW